jgi:PST family polysaccharide transporter
MTSSAEVIDRASLDRSLVRGVAWTGAVKWGTQIAVWASTLVVARLLSPQDYGVVGMAAVYLGFLTLLSEAGLGTTIIAMRDLDGHKLSQMHGLSAMMGIGGFLLTCIIAQPLAAFFNSPDLRWVVIALSANFIIIALRTVPQASLQRQLRFGRVALLDGANSLITAIVAIVLATAGFRYWSLVIAALAGSAVATTIALASRPTSLARPNFAELREALHVSRDIIIGSISWYVFQNADFFVAGKLLGAVALGWYTFAWNLAYSIVEKITSLVSGVTSSIFSAAKHDPALLTRYLTQITGALALALFPATIGLALVAPDLTALVGDKWSPAITPLRLLVVYAGFRALTSIFSQALTITGDARYTMQRSVTAAFVLPIGFVIGARWGVNGIAAAWIVCHAPVVMIPLLYRTASKLGIGFGAYVPALRAPVVSTAIMAGAVALTIALLPASMPRVARLVVEIAIGGIFYAGSLWFLFRERVLALVRATSQLRGDAATPATT